MPPLVLNIPLVDSSGGGGGESLIGDNIATGQVNIGSSPTQIVPARAARKSITISCSSGSAIYIGNSSVSSSNGLKQYDATNDTVITLHVTCAIYGIDPGAMGVATYLEVY